VPPAQAFFGLVTQSSPWGGRLRDESRERLRGRLLVPRLSLRGLELFLASGEVHLLNDTSIYQANIRLKTVFLGADGVVLSVRC